MPERAPKLNGAHPDGIDIQRATSKQVAVREMRAAQEVIVERLKRPDIPDKSIAILSSTYLSLREGIRIEKNIIKPGSKNISVRELSASERAERLPISRTSRDYLTDARRVRAQADAPPVPAQTTDKPPN